MLEFISLFCLIYIFLIYYNLHKITLTSLAESLIISLTMKQWVSKSTQLKNPNKSLVMYLIQHIYLKISKMFKNLLIVNIFYASLIMISWYLGFFYNKYFNWLIWYVKYDHNSAFLFGCSRMFQTLEQKVFFQMIFLIFHTKLHTYYIVIYDIHVYLEHTNFILFYVFDL